MGLIALDLATGTVAAVPTDPADFDGPIAALRLLVASRLGPDPVDAPLALVAGTVAGSGAPGTARCAAVGVSPLSGANAETRAEGRLGTPPGGRPRGGAQDRRGLCSRRTPEPAHRLGAWCARLRRLGRRAGVRPRRQLRRHHARRRRGCRAGRAR